MSAWAHKAKEEFTIYAPRDLTLDIDFDNQSITSPNTNLQQYVEPIQNWEVTGMFQLHIPKIYLWTDAKNVWVEENCAVTSRHNNLTLVGGWWNLSEWSRLGSFAFDVVDKSQPVVIKRGDPLYRLSFYKENDLTASYEMVKATLHLNR